MAPPQPALRQSRERHLHIASERCPVCDQPIPNERAQEIHARMEARERALTEAANLRAAQQFAMEREQIETNANAAIENARKEHAEAIKKITEETAAREAAARAAGKKEADAALQEKLVVAEQAKADAEAAAQERIAALEQAAKARDADWQEQLAAAERTKADAEAASQERIAALQQAARTRDAEWQEKVAAVEREKQGTVDQYEALKANQEQVVNDRVQEVREAMEKANADALGAERAKHFEDRQKLTDRLEDFKRQLEKKTADELGEGAEVDLFEALKGEFEDDKIERIGNGSPGADIRHVVMHNGKAFGTIIYDSKNRRRWEGEYVNKLARDRRAEGAEHAILSTLKFPEKARQVHVDRGTGIIIANPARVLALVQVLREHVVHVHTLRLSNTERAKKTAALYDFITSKRCRQLFDSIDTYAEELLKLQVKEKQTHDRTWDQQGKLYRSIQKARADLGVEIDLIIEAE